MIRKPQWLRVSRRTDPNQEVIEGILRRLKLNTVCREANCPNYTDCFSRKTATFMILGTHCTRDCRFCNVQHGQPQPVDTDEPDNVAQAVKELGLLYVVITSVTRDDLPDGGAGHFAATIRAIRHTAPDTAVEALIPDFQGDLDSLQRVTDAFPAVISHNMETVKPLYQIVRPQAEYQRSLNLLRDIKRFQPTVRSKTGIMLGLGETWDQVLALFDDLRDAGCEFLTIGQYLAPSREHIPVREYIEPRRFEEYGAAAREKGFDFVASAPLVRSSYHAGEALGI
ncbi:MAG: lipoyl synthase [Clostridia bacterium]|nr:lipoyl synthase [Clostridia bacterium]